MRDSKLVAPIGATNFCLSKKNPPKHCSGGFNIIELLYSSYLNAACAADSLAIGTRKGEQLT
jgi:hypothetical protein